MSLNEVQLALIEDMSRWFETLQKRPFRDEDRLTVMTEG